MPICKTSGIKTGELRFFNLQGRKIELCYKIICNFRRNKRICNRSRTKIYNNNNYLGWSPGMAFAYKYKEMRLQKMCRFTNLLKNFVSNNTNYASDSPGFNHHVHNILKIYVIWIRTFWHDVCWWLKHLKYFKNCRHRNQTIRDSHGIAIS